MNEAPCTIIIFLHYNCCKMMVLLTLIMEGYCQLITSMLPTLSLFLEILFRNLMHFILAFKLKLMCQSKGMQLY